MPRPDEFKKHRTGWVIMFLSGGMKTLVNQVEYPFARSLVACDTPVNSSVYSGSPWCGDRLVVIQEGNTITAIGQAQESFFMLCTLITAAVIVGAFGRKLMVVISLAGTTASVGIFIVASITPELGRILYASGQALQGLYPIEYLWGIILMDWSRKLGADGQAIFQLSQYVVQLTELVWTMGVGSFVQWMEFTNYLNVWIVIFAVNVLVLVFAVVAFPESKDTNEIMTEDAKEEKDANKDANEEKIGIIAKVWREVASYTNVLGDWRARRYLLKSGIENCELGFLPHIFSVQLMAYHLWGQAPVTILTVGQKILGLACMGIFNIYEVILKNFGFWNSYVYTCAFLLLSQIVVLLTLPVTDKFALSLWFVAVPMLGGFIPFQQFVDARFCEKKQMERFISVRWIMGYLIAIFIGPLWASLFTAHGTTWSDRATLGIALSLVILCMIFMLLPGNPIGIYDMNGREGFGVTIKLFDQAFVEYGRMRAAMTKCGCYLQPEWPFVSELVWGPGGFQEVFKMGCKDIGGPFADEQHFGTTVANFCPDPDSLFVMCEKGGQLSQIADNVEVMSEMWQKAYGYTMRIWALVTEANPVSGPLDAPLKEEFWKSAGFEEILGLTIEQASSLYIVISEASLPVSETMDPTSLEVAQIQKDTPITVLEIAEKADEGIVRARILSPPGWISAWKEDKSAFFIWKVSQFFTEEQFGMSMKMVAPSPQLTKEMCGDDGKLKRLVARLEKRAGLSEGATESAVEPKKEA